MAKLGTVPDTHRLTGLMEDASRIIQQHPGQLTKTALAGSVKGKRQRVLQALDALVSQGFAATTPGDRGRDVYHCVKRFPRQHAFPVGGAEVDGDQFPRTVGEPTGATDGSVQSAFPRLTNDREAPHTDGIDSEAALVIEPRCRCCRRPDLRDRVNRMLASGFSLRAIFESLAAVNASLPPKSRVTMDSLETHRRKHFDVQVGASSVWRNILEQRVAAESATYEEGVINLLTPRIYFEAVMTKAFAGLTDEAAAVSIDQGVAAARELGKLTAQGDDELKWARTQAQLNRVVEVMRALPAEYQELVLAKLEGRPGPPPPGGGPLALIEGGGVTTDVEEFDSLDGDDEDFGDDED